jgi:glycosyltransferase involved in cell wall biosynthesis
MRILYIPVTKKIKEKNFQNYLKCFFYDIYIVLKNFTFTKTISRNTSGYIDSAIHSNAYTIELPYSFCIMFSKIINLFFDGIFVNWKFTNYRSDINDLEFKLKKLSKKFKIKKVIVDGTDRSINIIKEEILEGFDFVIKREKNKSISNKKYLTTMLPCRLINYKVSKKNETINWSKIGMTKPNNEFKYDIFFSGQQSSESRNELVNFIKKQNFNFYGVVENSKLPYEKYLETIYNSSINLALEGKGEFTFRHLEILASCSFMICQSSINQLELPLPLIDGKHFVSFDNKNDLLEKIIFYLKNMELRNEIALDGRRVLEEYYSPKTHGKFLFDKIFKKIN